MFKLKFSLSGYPYKDEAQTALFKGPVRNVLYVFSSRL